MASRTRHTDINALLNRLLDRHEGQQAAGPQKTMSEFVSQDFPSAAAEQAFKEAARHMERAGGIRLHMDKGESSHLMLKVSLTSPEKVYEHLKRRPLSDIVSQSISRLKASFPLDALGGAYARDAIDRLEMEWGVGRRPYRLSPDNLPTVQEFLKAYSAARMKNSNSTEDLRDLRTYSRQVCGDSKLIERHLSKILSETRVQSSLGDEIDDAMLISFLGLEKFPHLVQFAADIPHSKDAFDLGCHVGLHPGLIDDLHVPPLRYLITIENYASFNRYVREAREAHTAILYTGGWPGRNEIRLIRKFSQSAEKTFHWGDIDMAGAAIADAVWEAAEGGFELHMMAPALALNLGRPRQSTGLKISKGSPALALSEWLTTDEAHVLEQEELDPVAASQGSQASTYG